MGENINPPLEFTNIPEEVESLVLIMDDPDAPRNPFTHWVVWNIEPVAKIEEDSIPGIEGINTFQKDRLWRSMPSLRNAQIFLQGLCTGQAA